MSFGSGYSAAVLADAPLGYWQLGEAEGYAQAVLADNPVGYWRLGDSESYAQAVLRDGAIGYWKLEEASGPIGADASGNGRAVTYVAPITYGTVGPLATPTTGVTLPGGQTGNTGYAVINGAANVAVGTGPMSFECWVRTTAPGPTVHFIADNKVGSSNNPGFGLSVSTSGLVTFALGNGSAYFETTTPVGSPVIADGQWHHVVIVLERLYDAVHDRARTYVDGVLQRSIDVTAAGWNLTSPIALFLGRFATVVNPTGFDLNGSIDEVAWYLTALTAGQVANHYALRLSTRTATAALVATDTTPAGRHGTYNGGITLAQSSALADGTTAARGDGASGYVFVGNSTALQIVGDLTVEVWVNLASLATRQTVITKSPANEFEMTVETSGAVSFYNMNESVNAPGASITAGAWYHIVVTRVVATKTLTIYVNGVSVRVGAYTLVVTSGTAPVQLGRTGSAGGSQYTNGSIDDVAIYNYTLSAQQVANHYALRLSTVGAATGYAAGVLADAATGFWRLGEAEGYAQAVLADAPTTYWRLEETSGPTAVDSAPGATRPITLPGSGITYRVGGALANGTSGYTLANPNRATCTAIAVGTTATFEFWLIPVAGATLYGLIVGQTSGGASLYYDQTRNKINLQVGGGAGGDRFNTTALTPGTLYHVVVSIAAGTATFYINGVADGTAVGWPGISVDSVFNVGGNSTPLACTLLDELAIYPIALSAQQAAAHYALRRSTITTVSVATVADAVAGQTGTVQPGVALGQSGPFPDGTTAALFDGATGFIIIPDAPAQNPGLGSYSYEAWVKRAPGISASEFVICKSAGAGVTGGGGELFLSATGVFTSRLNSTLIVQSVTGFADGLWHHAVISMNRTTNLGQWYVDGIASGPSLDLSAASAVDLSGGGGDLLIGKRPTGNVFNGVIANVSIYRTALSAGAAAAHYARGLSALVALDSSANGRTGTYVGGVTLGQAGAVPVDGAALFDGATGVVRIGNYTVPATFSVEAFVKTTDASAGPHAIVSTLDGGANSIQFGIVSGHLRMTIDSATPVTVDTVASIADGAYHHLVVTNNGTTTTFYVDGAQVQQTAQTHAAHASAWQLARDPAGTSLYLGTLDDVAVYSTVLTPTQVATHYAARLAGVPPGSSSSDSEEEDEIYDRLRGFYGSISGSYFVLAADTGTITLVPAVPKHTHFVQRLEVQITTPLAGAVWTLQDGAGAPIAVAPFPASAVGHYVIDLGPQGVPCTEATSLVLSISGGGSGAVGWVAWEGFKQLTLGAAA